MFIEDKITLCILTPCCHVYIISIYIMHNVIFCEYKKSQFNHGMLLYIYLKYNKQNFNSLLKDY